MNVSFCCVKINLFKCTNNMKKFKPKNNYCKLLLIFLIFQPYMYNPYSPFAPVVDTWAKEPLLPQHPYILLRDKHVHDIPWMITYVSAEGLYPGSGM